jgi:ABC-type arginine/histidine transport system permease subunit
MGHVNYALLVVSFLLGFLLTLALTIRRVEREVPVRGNDD